MRVSMRKDEWKYRTKNTFLKNSRTRKGEAVRSVGLEVRHANINSKRGRGGTCFTYPAEARQKGLYTGMLRASPAEREKGERGPK